ncbi:MAG: biopolymer transporter ExbD [Candidatus Latescibacterota bacterium]|jgi:biopolymer transport protein ExbD|nr:biopolymer transporter ExbD [Gemmatimonadota bacterium]MDP7364446.1 biopolymer transporter ExbD [Candidatus Latescibacterota bacterium]MEC8992751.1 biopolymer transporter ExbD [Candidatus Latescibacterota bacterium]MEC9377879.1 biopolymer transporter ExbD [Candidatus Latescibacterota bacterium]MEE3040354.1 biopolymer transporter ExbD [Candidatus Latescibacterota bacterium]|tara:strand:+ start:52 stop:459 length:408 start_codon:yes stop_codon:yes gene_type:complete
MAVKKEKAEERPDLTPMIDVVFQLLIFFMVTAVFAITPGLDIKLPEAEEAQAPEKENLFIVVDQDGNMKLNHQSVTFANLKDKLQEKRNLLDNTTLIIIQGDERATHGQIVQIMDIARQVGIIDQVIATEPNRGG